MEETEDLELEEDTSPPKEKPEAPKKRKRAVEHVDFEKIAKPVEEEPEELEPEEPQPKRKKYGETVLEKHLNKTQGLQVLRCIEAMFPEIAKEVLAGPPWKGKERHEWTEEEINQAIATIKFTQGVKSNTKLNFWAGEMGLQAIEDLCVNFTPVKAKGLHMLAKDPDFQELWKEVSIDMLTLEYFDPKKRLAIYLAKALYIIHSMNSQAEREGKVETPKVVPAETEKE